MLSAFTARPIIELRQRDKSKIETILAYGTRCAGARLAPNPFSSFPLAASAV